MRFSRLGWVAVLGLLLGITPRSAGQADDLRQQLEAAFAKGFSQW